MGRLGVALAAGALVLAFAGVAQAGTLSRVDATTLRYDADPGETNRIFVSTDSEGVRVIDTGATVTAGAGCTAPAAHEGHCAANQAQTRLEINAGDQDDYVDILPGTLNLAIVDGGAGEDELIGGGARSGNWLEGGPGADILRGKATADYHRRTNPVTVTVGDDLANDGEAGEGDFVSSEIIAVFGGAGDDDLTILNSSGVQERTELEGGDGGDTLSILRRTEAGWIFGGTGPDIIHNEALHGLVHGANGDDLIFGGDGSGQALWGEGGDDTLRGLDGDDNLFGNRGADIFLPGPGNDHVAGGHGPDTIFARDGQRDSLSGGPGKEDRARVDRGLDKIYDMEELF
jgi:serralysin